MVPPPSSADTPLSLGGQLRSLTASFWISNAMEMLERLAYYGLRTVLPIFLLLAVEEGGPQFDNVQKGVLYMWWAYVQSFVPIVSGGYADRFGYKRTVAVSVAIKVVGYLTMAFALPLAELSSGGASVGVPGHGHAFAWMLVGSLFLAFGTAVFKPGLQGIIGTQLDGRNGALGWGVFYQLVNVGGFLGPILAGVLRILDWQWVFLGCAAIVCLNWPLLLLFREPEHGDVDGEEPAGVLEVLVSSVAGILEIRLFAFLAVFSGFWAMFYQLFDLLPNFIEDWVDTRDVYATLAVPLFSLWGSAPPEAWGGGVPQEQLINLNAGMISLFAFLVGWMTGKVRSMTAMIVGIVVSAGGILLLGTTSGWAVLGAIALFSLGEMLASPTKMRYFAEIAPPGKKGLYLGYINATVGIGWGLGSRIAGSMYEEGGDKVALARRHLVEVLGRDPEVVDALPKTEVVPALADALALDAYGVRAVLWEAYAPADIWYWFATIGLVSMLGLLVFDQVTRRETTQSFEDGALILLTGLVTGFCYGVGVGVVLAGHLIAQKLLGARTVAWIVLAEVVLAVGWAVGSGLWG